MTETNSPLEPRLTLKQIRELSGCSHAYIYQQIKDGKLASPEKWGRSSRWKESDVRAWFSHYENNKS